jgi:hypothetical protein
MSAVHWHFDVNHHRCIVGPFILSVISLIFRNLFNVEFYTAFVKVIFVMLSRSLYFRVRHCNEQRVAYWNLIDSFNLALMSEAIALPAYREPPWFLY